MIINTNVQRPLTQQMMMRPFKMLENHSKQMLQKYKDFNPLNYKMEIRAIGNSRAGKSTKCNSIIDLNSQKAYKKKNTYDGFFISSTVSTTATQTYLVYDSQLPVQKFQISNKKIKLCREDLVSQMSLPLRDLQFTKKQVSKQSLKQIQTLHKRIRQKHNNQNNQIQQMYIKTGIKLFDDEFISKNCFLVDTVGLNELHVPVKNTPSFNSFIIYCFNNQMQNFGKLQTKKNILHLLVNHNFSNLIFSANVSLVSMKDQMGDFYKYFNTILKDILITLPNQSFSIFELVFKQIQKLNQNNEQIKQHLKEIKQILAQYKEYFSNLEKQFPGKVLPEFQDNSPQNWSNQLEKLNQLIKCYPFVILDVHAGPTEYIQQIKKLLQLEEQQEEYKEKKINLLLFLKTFIQFSKSSLKQKIKKSVISRKISLFKEIQNQINQANQQLTLINKKKHQQLKLKPQYKEFIKRFQGNIKKVNQEMKKILTDFDQKIISFYKNFQQNIKNKENQYSSKNVRSNYNQQQTIKTEMFQYIQKYFAEQNQNFVKETVETIEKFFKVFISFFSIDNFKKNEGILQKLSSFFYHQQSILELIIKRLKDSYEKQLKNKLNLRKKEWNLFICSCKSSLKEINQNYELQMVFISFPKYFITIFLKNFSQKEKVFCSMVFTLPYLIIFPIIGFLEYQIKLFNEENRKQSDIIFFSNEWQKLKIFHQLVIKKAKQREVLLKGQIQDDKQKIIGFQIQKIQGNINLDVSNGINQIEKVKKEAIKQKEIYQKIKLQEK